MRCPHCNEKTAPHDIWCIKCGKQTDVIANDLSAVKSLKSSWKQYSAIKGNNFPIGIIAALTGVLPTLILIWLQNFGLSSLPPWQALLISNLTWLLFLPVLLLPFSMVAKKDVTVFSLADFWRAFSSYPRYLGLSLITVLFYLIIHFVCQGDPILNLVWLVLVLYWIAIILPIPVLMERMQSNPYAMLKKVYLTAGDLRWNIFLLGFILFIVNLLAAAFLLVGLIITLPFSWIAIRNYTDKLIDFEVFDAE